MDTTALLRQKRRIQRLADSGVDRTTAFVHRDCKSAFDGLRTFLTDPASARDLQAALDRLNASKAASLAQTRRLSPFRYPGGKGWLRPAFRRWIADLQKPLTILVEPFAGGSSIGLAVAADMSAQVVLADIDEDVASVWVTLFHRPPSDGYWLCDQIAQFEMSEKNVRSVLKSRPRNRREAAFRTIVRNRTQRAGVMTEGAGRLRRGENDKGLTSRWYPKTLVERIRQLQRLRGRVQFRQQDAFSVIEDFIDRKDAVFFVDPPYTAGGPAPGRRLYKHCNVDHRRLLELIKSASGPAMLTYADTDEIRALAEEMGFEIVEAPMRTAHHKEKKELLLIKV